MITRPLCLVFCLLVFMLMITNGIRMLSSKKMKILIMGRGPSAYKSSSLRDIDQYDLVVKLKMCNCQVDKSKRCDIIVFYAHELNVEKETLKHYNQCKHLNKHILIFNPLYEPIREVFHNDYKDVYVETINNDMIKRWAKAFGFNWNIPPRFTTGMATILHFLHIFPKSTIYLTGFDNLVHNKEHGHFDDPMIKTTSFHSVEKEHTLLNHLIKNYDIKVKN